MLQTVCCALSLALAPCAHTASGDAITVMRQWGDFDVFCRLIERAGLTETLRAPGPLTVFAPTDEAFQRLGSDTLARLETPENREQLRALVLYHVVPQRLSVFALRRESPRMTVHGKTVTSLLMSGAMMVNDAFIDIEDIAASNGIVHGIDKVLMPPS